MLFSDDTSPEAREVLAAALREMTPGQRLKLALDATEAMRATIRADIARQHPDATAERRHELFLERWLGPELAREVIEWQRART